MATSLFVSETGNYTPLSVSALIHTGRGKLFGIFVSSASAGATIKVWDAVSAAVPVLVDTFVPLAPGFYPMPFLFGNGLYITVTGTLVGTVGWESVS